MSAQHQEEKPRRIIKPLGILEQVLERRCRSCASVMKPVARENEKWNGPGRKSGLRFACVECGEEAWIADRNSMIAILASGVVVLALATYALLNDALGFIESALFTEGTVISIMVALALMLLLLLFIFGGIGVLISGGTMLRNRHAYPIIGDDHSKSQIWLILILGIIPWLVFMGFGMVTFYNDIRVGEWVMFILFPIGFSPMFLAEKVGVSGGAVFMAAVFWLAAGGGTWWLWDEVISRMI